MRSKGDIQHWADRGQVFPRFVPLKWPSHVESTTSAFSTVLLHRNDNNRKAINNGEIILFCFSFCMRECVAIQYGGIATTARQKYFSCACSLRVSRDWQLFFTRAIQSRTQSPQAFWSRWPKSLRTLGTRLRDIILISGKIKGSCQPPCRP